MGAYTGLKGGKSDAARIKNRNRKTSAARRASQREAAGFTDFNGQF